MADPDALPHNLEAERAVLGACLIRQAAVGEVAGTLGADDFFRQAHADIWRAIRRLDDAGRAVDLVTIRDELARIDALDSVGGPAYVAALTDGVPRSTNVRAYAALVVESAAKRRLAIAVNRGASIAEIAAIVSRLTDGTGLEADDDSPPWAMLDVAEDDHVEPWRGIGRGLVAFEGAVVSITAASKQGKSTAAWADLAPFTREHKVLAIVGPSERGPLGWADYARLIASLGDDPRNVAGMLPPASLAGVARHLPDSGIGAVVVDSTASLMAALHRNENAVEDVRTTIDELRALGVPVVLIRHNVNAGRDPKVRDRDASRGAGSRDWRAAVDAEAEFRRGEDGVARLTWVGRDGCPVVTGYRLDKGCWPYCVEVLDAADLGDTADDGGADAGPTDSAAEQTVLDTLDGTEDAPWLMGQLEREIGAKLGRAGSKTGRWWQPFRAAVDRLYARGEIGADRDPSERRSGGRPYRLWKLPPPLSTFVPDNAAEGVEASSARPSARDVVPGEEGAEDFRADSEEPVPDPALVAEGPTLNCPRCLGTSKTAMGEPCDHAQEDTMAQNGSIPAPPATDDPRILSALDTLRACILPGQPVPADDKLLADAVFLAAMREARPRWAA